mgnify:CR=1 FL=1
MTERKNNMKKKEVVILTAALIIPGGLVVLGLWKAYELYKRKEKKEEKNVV